MVYVLTRTIPSTCTVTISVLRGDTCLAAAPDCPKSECTMAEDIALRLKARKTKYSGRSLTRNVKNLLEKT